MVSGNKAQIGLVTRVCTVLNKFVAGLKTGGFLEQAARWGMSSATNITLRWLPSVALEGTRRGAQQNW
jgi:hypothetical protein